MVLKSTYSNIPVYQISGSNQSRSLPDWLAKKRKRSLKHDPEYQSRIELIQEFEFEEASNKLKITNDGKYCVATGTYKPQIHVYEFDNLALKFERHTDAETLDFELVSDDWTKMILLQTDRTLEFHAQGGIHTRTRIPKFGRAIKYNRQTCDLYTAASGNEIYRLNVDQGRFLAPFESDSVGFNCLDINPAHGLLGLGAEDNSVEFWDPRYRRRIAKMTLGDDSQGVTALSFKNDGLNMAVGTGEGKTLLFDLRASDALLTKDQGYGFPIKKLDWIGEDRVMSADKRIVKIWDRQSGAAFTSMEPSVDINDVAWVKDTGMFFLANEGIPMHTYYIPALGPAPKWCSFLDSITEELEEKPVSTVYDNYKFVTRQELAKLNLSHLIGTNVVKSYMHGFFIHQDLYEQAKLITDPFAYRDHREREIKKRIEDERESRIRTAGAVAGAKIKVNKSVAQDLVNKDQQIDERFKGLFENPDFEIDEGSYEYMRANPHLVSQLRKKNKDVERRKDVVEKEKDRRTAAEREDDSDDESEHEHEPRKKHSQKPGQSDRRVHFESAESDSRPRMKVLNRGDDLDAEQTFADQAEADTESAKADLANKVKRTPAGEMELTFVPEKKTKKKVAPVKEQNREGRRRASKNAFRGM